jgi:arsenate reductase
MPEKITVFVKSNEDSSKEALKMIVQKGFKLEMRDLFIDSMTKDEFASIINATDLPAHECVRTVDKMYKKIFGEVDLTQMDKAQLFENLVKYPRLINRPIVIAGNRACIGRPPSKLEEFLSSIPKS